MSRVGSGRRACGVRSVVRASCRVRQSRRGKLSALATADIYAANGPSRITHALRKVCRDGFAVRGTTFALSTRRSTLAVFVAARHGLAAVKYLVDPGEEQRADLDHARVAVAAGVEGAR